MAATRRRRGLLRRRAHAAETMHSAMRASMVMAAGQRGRHRADQDIAVQHVPQFVRHHALDFVVVHQLQNARGERHRSVRRIAAGGEGVGRSSGIRYSLGMGSPMRCARPCDDGGHAAVDLRVFGLGVTGCAEYMASAILSEKK